MKYLLDTGIIVDHLRKRKLLDASWFEEGCGISIITQAELFYGAEKSKDSAKEFEKIQNTLSVWCIEVFNLNKEIVGFYGKLKASLEKKGKRLDEFDLLIGATAISENLILVTGNSRHFKRIFGLSLVES